MKGQGPLETVGLGVYGNKDFGWEGTTTWAAAQGPTGRAAVLDKVVELYRSGVLQPPVVQAFPLGRWRDAFETLSTPHRGRKVVLDCQVEDGVEA
ncbi:hypothetical protein TSOC_002451 [Tetrabaena socialis]|uniref:Uncharacterized protein n=1 Tax=Tetrabaena socialis TaxID=47790 RepID=A0A2J8AE54_9CHLO|nr:hypothetical protein TSOC_002451 [Tetrabaena socialis]|eukprot:PNH10794.1 hypothetical protein TSOC_002451 [Tetrabaena socialis]